MQSDSKTTGVAEKTDEKRQFDFWIGDWDVSWGEDQRGTNHVYAILDGQAIQENFDGRPAITLKGISVSTYDPNRRKWRQTWVDNEDGYFDLTGEFKDNQMTLYAQRQTGETLIHYRMLFYNITSEQFGWRWDRSTDGQDWAPAWEIHYQRMAGAT